MAFEWKRRTAFAELAEALDVRSDEIMAASPIEDGRGYLVLYTTGTDDLATAVVHRTLLARDADGILRQVRHATAGTLADFMDQIDNGLADA
jgi:hypothetical protein